MERCGCQEEWVPKPFRVSANDVQSPCRSASVEARLLLCTTRTTARPRSSARTKRRMRSRRLQRRMPKQTDSADWPCTSVTSSGELFEVLQQADDPVNVSTRFTRSRSRRRSPSSLERWLVVAPRRVSATLASWCGIRGHGDTGIILEHGRSKSETLAHAWLKAMERWAATCLLQWTCR